MHRVTPFNRFSDLSTRRRFDARPSRIAHLSQERKEQCGSKQAHGTAGLSRCGLSWATTLCLCARAELCCACVHCATPKLETCANQPFHTNRSSRSSQKVGILKASHAKCLIAYVFFDQRKCFRCEFVPGFKTNITFLNFWGFSGRWFSTRFYTKIIHLHQNYIKKSYHFNNSKSEIGALLDPRCLYLDHASLERVCLLQRNTNLCRLWRLCSNHFTGHCVDFLRECPGNHEKCRR